MSKLSSKIQGRIGVVHPGSTMAHVTPTKSWPGLPVSDMVGALGFGTITIEQYREIEAMIEGPFSWVPVGKARAERLAADRRERARLRNR